jgi:hypothetical protein
VATNPSNINQVYFTNPLDPASSIVQQQDIARQQALADALRQQSLSPIEAGRGAVSWTQGVAKLAQALAGASIQNRTNAREWDLATSAMNAQRAMFDRSGKALPQIDPASNPYRQQGSGLGAGIRRFFGIGRDGHMAMSSDAGGLANPPQSTPLPVPALPAQPAAPPPNPANAPIQDVLNGLDSQAQQLGIQGQQAPQQSPPAADPSPPQPTAAPYQRGPLSLTGNPLKDYLLQATNPEAYSGAVINSNTPGDFAKLLIARGIDPNSPQGQQLMQQQIDKQNNIPPISGRPGAPLFSAVDGHIISMAPQNIPGGNPVIQNGQFTGSYTQAPGAAQIEQNMTAAHATGQAAGETVQVYNPSTGQMDMVPKSTVLKGGFSATPPPGFAAASDVTGKNSATEFANISNGAADVPNRIFALRNMSQMVNDPASVLGVGSDGYNKMLGYLGTLTGSAPPSVSNVQEFNKWASQYSARKGQELGLSGSDARVQIAIHATPNSEMQKPALQAIIPQMIGLENAQAGHATAANQWQAQHGPQTVQAFRTEWNKVYDPRIYTWLASGTVKQEMAKLKKDNPADYNALVHKATVLGQLGALPQ